MIFFYYVSVDLVDSQWLFISGTFIKVLLSKVLKNFLSFSLNLEMKIVSCVFVIFSSLNFHHTCFFIWNNSMTINRDVKNNKSGRRIRLKKEDHHTST